MNEKKYQRLSRNGMMFICLWFVLSIFWCGVFLFYGKEMTPLDCIMVSTIYAIAPLVCLKIIKEIDSWGE